MDIRDHFEQAATDSKNLPEKPSNETLLQLYSLYKQGSIGDVNIDPPSNPFDLLEKPNTKPGPVSKGNLLSMR